MSTTPPIAIYRITLLPSLEVVASCASLREAVVWIETYNSIMAGSGQRAAIDQVRTWQAAA
jgi:hypothetical protein